MEKSEGIWGKSFAEDCALMDEILGAKCNFDIVSREISVGGRKGHFFFIDGFCKEDVMQKMLQFFLEIQQEEMPATVEEFMKNKLPYVEVAAEEQKQKVITGILSGEFVLLVEGYGKAVLINARTYPKRDVQEPEKDKVLRGSKDGFVETLLMNTALIRRRIRDTHLKMELFRVGKASQTDVVIVYMDNRAEKKLLYNIRNRISSIEIDSLTMNQESLVECMVPGRWYNPFPKFKYSERPDTTCAQLLEGSVVILVDNAPSAIILPTSFFDVMDEADDYYFPPLTGSYLRITRTMIALLTYIMTPTFLLLMSNPTLVPRGFQFILLRETPNIPLIWQFLILELAIDGLRLAAVSTPNMLNTPLSIMAGLVLGEFSVKSGWFSSEVMLYMAFVAVANYTQTNYELGYALKFMRIVTLINTAIFGIYGYIGGILFTLFCMLTNKTLSDKGYLYPLIPLDIRKLKYRFIRERLPGSRQQADKIKRK